jgi:AcrR family transcriptional regulator
MFKTIRLEHQATERGDATRERILGAALRLFRRRGFERTTMREIARAAGVSLGSTYYYFPSKEALVLAFYGQVQERHESLVRTAALPPGDLVVRVRSALLGKLEILREDRALLGALFRYAGERGHPLSVFGEATRVQREQAVATFSLALEGARLSPPLRDLAARALWLAHLGLILYFIHDTSDDAVRTRRLAERTAEVFCSALRLVSLPGAMRLVAPTVAALRDAGLVSPSATKGGASA